MALCSFGLALFGLGLLLRLWAGLLSFLSLLPMVASALVLGFAAFGLFCRACWANSALPLRVCQAWRFSGVFSSVHFSRCLRFASLAKPCHRWGWCLPHIGANQALWVGGGWALAAITWPNKSVKGTRRPLAVLKFRFYQGSAASLRFH